MVEPIYIVQKHNTLITINFVDGRSSPGRDGGGKGVGVKRGRSGVNGLKIGVDRR